MRSRPQLSSEHVLAIAVLSSIFIIINLHPIRPHDFWWHMAVGREIFASGLIPETDIYSQFMLGAQYPSYKMFWLMDIFLFTIFRLGGPALVVFIHSGIITGAYAVLLLLCFRLTNSRRISSIAVFFAASLGFNDWNVRPQTIAFLLGVIFLFSIYWIKANQRRSLVFIFPVVMAFWANSHGTFFIALGLLVIWLAEELLYAVYNKGGRIDRASFNRISLPLSAFLLSILASLINPQGMGIFSYITSMVSNPAVTTLIVEWAPPSFNNLGGALFMLGLIFSAVLLALSPLKPDLFHILIFITFSLLALNSSRGIVWFGMIMAPVLSVHLVALFTPGIQEKPVRAKLAKPINFIFACFFITLSFLTLPFFKDYLVQLGSKAGLISKETPVKAVEFLFDEGIPGPLFHEMSYGSYLIFTAYPDYPVFIDPRFELYPYDYWIEYIKISRGDIGWDQTLDNYGIQSLMLDKRNQETMIQEVDASGDWERKYEDDRTVIYTIINQ